MRVFTTEMIRDAFNSLDISGIVSWISRGGLSPAWQDEKSRTLMHYAAASGMSNMVDYLAELGVRALSFDADGLRPLDLARVLGHALAAEKLRVLQAAEMEKICEAIPHITMASLRRAGDLEQLIRAGHLPQVLALAQRDGGFTAADFLTPGKFNPRVIETVCQEGLLADILKPALFGDRPEAVLEVFAALPAAYSKLFDGERLKTAVRQQNIKGTGGDKPLWVSPRHRPPKPPGRR